MVVYDSPRGAVGVSGAWETFKADAARWLVPEQIGDPNEVSGLRALALLRLYRPLRPVALFRFGQWGRDRGIRGLAWLVQEQLQGRYGLDLPVSTEIGPGFYLAHPTGVSITAARIGANATLVGALTIGVNGHGNEPRIGDFVYLGAGCRVIGDIVLGDHVTVGANSVVNSDVADHLTVVGAPAKPTAKSLKAAEER